jgi:hypothetical protein
MIEIGAKYRHYKTRELYEVIGLAVHSETLEPLVLYKQLYGEFAIWARPAAMFLEDVGGGAQRFEFVEGAKFPTPR